MEYQRRKSSVQTAQDMASVLYWTLRVLAGVIVTYVGTVFMARPIYATLCGTVCWLLLKYVLNADSMWHQSQHLENQFWMLISFTLSATLMFAPDSPYLASAWISGEPMVGHLLGGFVVVVATMTAHFLDKNHHRNRLRTMPSLVAFDELIQNSSADELVKMMNGYMGELDHTLPSTFATMWNVSKFMRIERSILGVFNNCSREELNYVIVRSEMKLITYKLKNHSAVGATALPTAKQNRCRSELLDILARRRISDLNLASRAVVLDVIQGLRLSIHPDTAKEAQEWIFNLLSTVRGDDLSELKQLVDNKGSAESMHKLVFDHVVDTTMREKILQHFRKQASIQAAQMAMGSSLARKRLQRGAWRKILSDVDDTLFSSGGRYPAGIDVSYKRKVFYPAVTSLYRELNIGSRGTLADAGVWPPKRSGDLVFLSARPHVYKDVTETTMYSKFRGFMKAQALHCMPSLLPGDLESGQAFMMQGTFMPMARKKLRNFQEYYAIYPEYTHVFIGDNGQADVKAAEYMVEEFGTKVVERVYIHEVQPREFTFGYEAGVSEQRWHQSGIVFCRTYVRAALDAAQQGLIRYHGLRRVAVAAHEDFERIKYTWSDPYERDVRRLELNDDLEAANTALAGVGIATTGIIRGIPEFVLGTLVYTMFGKGYVASYHSSTGVYEILLDWGLPQSPPRLYSQLHGIFRNEKALRDVQRRLFRPRSRTENLSQLTDSLTRGRSSRSSSSISRPEDLQLPNDRTVREAFTASLYKVDKPRHLDPFSSFLMPVMFYPGKKDRAVSLRKRSSTETRTPRRPSIFDTQSDATLLSVKRTPSRPSSAASGTRPISTEKPKSEPALLDEAIPVQRVLQGPTPLATPRNLGSPDSSAGETDTFAEQEDFQRVGGCEEDGVLIDEDDRWHARESKRSDTSDRRASASSNLLEQSIEHIDADDADEASVASPKLESVRNEASEDLANAAAAAAAAAAVAADDDATVSKKFSGRTLSIDSSDENAGGAFEHAVDATARPVSPSPPATPAPSDTIDKENESEVILELGTRVKTPFGDTVVLYFRESDSIYVTAIPSMNALAYFSEDSLLMWNAKLFEERARAMVNEGSYPRRLYGLMKTLFTRGGEPSADNKSDAGSSITNKAASPSKRDIEHGSVVSTPYGQGLVLKVRDSGMLELRLLWASRAYIPIECVTLDEEASTRDAMSAANLLQLDQSPLQKARELISKNWELLKLPFSVMQRGGFSQGLAASVLSSNAPTATTTLPSSDSLVSLCSLVTATSGTSSDTYLSALDEAYGIRIGDTVDTNGLGTGEVLEVRPDGFFVIALPYGRAYIHVPRLLLGGGSPHAGPAIPVGTQVITPFGPGVVVAFREEDSVYAVAISNGTSLMAYLVNRPSMRDTSSAGSLLQRSAGSLLSPEGGSMSGGDRNAAGSSGSFKSSILSFITNIIHYPKTDSPESEDGADGASKGGETHVRASSDSSWQNVPHAMAGIPPGHTEFSWLGGTVEANLGDFEEDDGDGDDEGSEAIAEDRDDGNHTDAAATAADAAVLAAEKDKNEDENEDAEEEEEEEDMAEKEDIPTVSASPDNESNLNQASESDSGPLIEGKTADEECLSRDVDDKGLAADQEIQITTQGSGVAVDSSGTLVQIPPGHTAFSWIGTPDVGSGDDDGDDEDMGEKEEGQHGQTLAAGALEAVKSTLPVLTKPFSL
ncbi:Hypothetical Protein FCC1311_008232 [Hondaea fermentalgiana]|uniref:Phosphatidate phosphatase APP1 catalytic domain-containing protein n=1 Tax=Hondaea fermentalgiana TaxID=2315210 RepID=A0A2R5GA83_9STRA|nr:Hypothetical Protein FCC1311_008232 [Hondaea fermentalgiana]|eukprot:GBG24604.1 Hypothetical Protein FCC1311_008232 [Hondaea fermentalgiana]